MTRAPRGPFSFGGQAGCDGLASGTGEHLKMLAGCAARRRYGGRATAPLTPF
jgi:hypothetical protein